MNNIFDFVRSMQVAKNTAHLRNLNLIVGTFLVSHTISRNQDSKFKANKTMSITPPCA